jgi:hypothetical protein
MSKDDLVCVSHMLDLCRKVMEKTRSARRIEYDGDENLRLAAAHIIIFPNQAQSPGSVAHRAKRVDLFPSRKNP